MFERISTDDALTHIESGAATVVDIRDPESRAAGHIPGSIHLTNETLPHFLAETDKETVLIVYCYHGNMSQSAGRFLVQQGFARVYSMNGGFEEWRTRFPDRCVSSADASATD